MIFVNFIIIHENIHQQISYYHGCSDGDITYGLIESHFVCNEYAPGTEDRRKQEYNLHSWNEIIGYNFMIFMIIIFTLIWFLNKISISIKDNKKEKERLLQAISLIELTEGFEQKNHIENFKQQLR